MKPQKTILLAVLFALGFASASQAALQDNWLSLLMKRRLNQNFKIENRRINAIVSDIQAEPKGKEFAAKEGLRDAVVKGLEAARERQKELKDRPIGPTPAQAGAVKICEELELEYPLNDSDE